MRSRKFDQMVGLESLPRVWQRFRQILYRKDKDRACNLVYFLNSQLCHLQRMKTDIWLSLVYMLFHHFRLKIPVKTSSIRLKMVQTGEE